jgi:translation elongation factor EF-4
MDVFRQRLEDEYDANVIITAPTVPYKGQESNNLLCWYLNPSGSGVKGWNEIHQ